MRLDYGVAHVLHGRTRTVIGTSEIIGVPPWQIERWNMYGMVDGDTLTLDTAGEYVYQRLGPSAHTPDIMRYKRVRKALSKKKGERKR